MQVQHERQLFDNSCLNQENFVQTLSQSIDEYTLSKANLVPIEHLVSCPVANVIAAYNYSTNQILVFDTKSSVICEKFPLKPCDKKFSKQSFTVRGLDFSPDGTRLAVGQTDCIIYIYKLSSTSSLVPYGADNQLVIDKPVITGKFVCSSPVVDLLWTDQGILFATQDGKVKIISFTMKSASESAAQPSPASTKVTGIYNSPKGILPLSLAHRSSLLAIGLIDHSVVVTTYGLVEAQIESQLEQQPTRRVSFSNTTNCVIAHSCPPYCLAIVQNNVLCIAGPDGRLTLHLIQVDYQQMRTQESINCKLLHSFELKEEISSIDYSHPNEMLAVATRNRLVFIKYDQESSSWQLEPSTIELRSQSKFNPRLICVRWTRDGGQLFASTLTGSIEIFRCIWNKQSINEQLDICHIAKNRIRITDRARNLLATYKTQNDIKKVNLLDSGQSVIVFTNSSLLLARLGQPWQQSEINWPSRANKSAKFCFSYPGYVLIHDSISRRLSVIKLGQNDVLQTLELEDGAKKDIISVRQFPTPSMSQSIDLKLSPITRIRSASSRSRNSSLTIVPEQATNHIKDTLKERFAYVDNPRSVRLEVIDLKTNAKLITRNHERRIIWLELSYSGDYLVFKDVAKNLYLIDLRKNDEIIELLHSCEFAVWLIDTDILVGQSKYMIYIWYNIEELDTKSKIDSRASNVTNAPPLIDLSFCEVPYPLVKDTNSDYQLVLSNNQTIQLDKLLTDFYSRIMYNKLESACEFLETSRDSKTKVNHLWHKLGWIAIKQGNCLVARRAFDRLNQQSLVRYLDECTACELDEQKLRLAKLQGDWDTFELMADGEQVVETYRRLKKYNRLIDYLGKTQKFRQRDLAEQEYLRWLIDRRYYMRAARIQAKSGDLPGAVELLMNHKRYDEAHDLFMDEQKTVIPDKSVNLINLANELKTQLIAADKMIQAAQVTENLLGFSKEALDLYLKAHAFEMALDLARRVAVERIPLIEESYGDWLMDCYRGYRLSRKRASRAVELYQHCGKKTKALNSAIELKQWQKGLDILRDHDAGGVAEQAKVVAEAMLKDDKVAEASESYRLGGHYLELVQLYINQANYEAAYEVSLNNLNSTRQEIQEKFIELAVGLEQVDDAKSEQIYLMLDRSDLAIEMHRKKKNYERMLELIGKYQSDQLESSLFLLAREMEAAGEYHLAERYLLRASDSEWTNVVRMYRLASLWEDAYRVASANCPSERDPLLVQLAYWWCKSLNDPQQGHELLTKRLPNMLQPVVEFCCENRNFQMAIDLASFISPQKGLQRDLIKRFACYLEEEHRFRSAEELLLKYHMIDDAAQMYLDNEMYTEALRVVEDELTKKTAEDGERRVQLNDLLNKTLIQCAEKLEAQVNAIRPISQVKGLVDQTNMLNGQARGETLEKLQAIQQLYLRAQRPELAVALYKKRGMWQEAIQVAQRFAPQLVEDVERSLDEQVAEEVAPILATLQPSASGSSNQKGGDPRRVANGMIRR